MRLPEVRSSEADELAREHAQHGRHDGREGAQQPFGVESPASQQVCGHHYPVDVAHDVAFEGQRSGPSGVGRGCELQQQSVAEQDRGGDDGTRAHVEVDEQQRREHPRQADPAQYARQAQRGEVELEQAAVNESQHHERQAAADHFQVDAPLAHPFFALFGE